MFRCRCVGSEARYVTVSDQRNVHVLQCIVHVSVALKERCLHLCQPHPLAHNPPPMNGCCGNDRVLSSCFGDVLNGWVDFLQGFGSRPFTIFATVCLCLTVFFVVSAIFRSEELAAAGGRSDDGESTPTPLEGGHAPSE